MPCVAQVVAETKEHWFRDSFLTLFFKLINKTHADHSNQTVCLREYGQRRLSGFFFWSGI